MFEVRWLDFFGRVDLRLTAGGWNQTQSSSLPSRLQPTSGQERGNQPKAREHLVSTLRRIYGPSFAAGESESAKLSDVLAKLHETSLTQLIKDHESGGLDEKVRKAALA